MLKDKKIILGVTGSIAAYKAATLIRLLKKQGADVQVVMTEAATHFISELTLSTLSQHPVFIHLTQDGQWNNHVSLGRDADLFLIAPASANTLSKMANGSCDNMLLATYLSANCPIFVAPAMDVDMWHHPATRDNIKKLKERDLRLIDVEQGELASGLVGEGRMAEPEHILQKIQSYFSSQKKGLGKRAIVTAGPTYEPIDPVRFIGNHSSGKQGIAIAEALSDAGVQVDLILGPSSLRPSGREITTHRVMTTEQMKRVCDQLFPKVDIAVLSAAVSDYRPAKPATQKIKKSKKTRSIDLKKNPDILKSLGQQKKKNQLLIGFALETENEEKNALKKLKEKNLDLIVLNSLNDQGAGFQTDTNKVTLLKGKKEKVTLPLLSKKEVAREIVHYIISKDEKIS